MSIEQDLGLPGGPQDDVVPRNESDMSGTAGRAAAGGAGRGAGSAPAGAPPSNTAPASCIQAEAGRILRTGFDSLYLSYAGEMTYDLSVQLRRLKSLAQSTDLAEQAAAIHEVGGHRFEVRDRGSRMFPYVLTDNAYFIALKGLDAKRLPLAHIQVSSGYLLQKGLEAVCRELDEIVGQLGEREFSGATVSRADLCCDFVPGIPMDEFPLNAWVSRGADHPYLLR